MADVKAKTKGKTATHIIIAEKIYVEKSLPLIANLVY